MLVLITCLLPFFQREILKKGVNLTDTHCETCVQVIQCNHQNYQKLYSQIVYESPPVSESKKESRVLQKVSNFVNSGICLVPNK